jgi:molybdopterin/thiamine biosynthesis adenylyltransferase
MTRRFLHEELYRGRDQWEGLAAHKLVICGAGALGSHLAENLARQGFRRLKIVDRDRVEEHNVSTQVFGIDDVGAFKVDVLRNRLFRALEVEIETASKELHARNARRLLKGADIVVDTFDNSHSRQLVQQECRDAQIDCLHIGLYEDYCEIIWDEDYCVPKDVEGDVCEYPLARNLVLLAVAIASESLVRFVLEGTRKSRSATLEDFLVESIEPPSKD